MTAPINTLFLLMAEYGTGQIPLEKCCNRFGLSPTEAKRLAARQRLPVPAYRLGTQKAPWLIDAAELAAYIDAQQAAAKRHHAAISSAAQGAAA